MGVPARPWGALRWGHRSVVLAASPPVPARRPRATQGSRAMGSSDKFPSQTGAFSVSLLDLMECLTAWKRSPPSSGWQAAVLWPFVS